MEALLRFGVFMAVLTAMALWEWIKPVRQNSQTCGRRWPINLGLTALNVAILRLCIGAGAGG